MTKTCDLVIAQRVALSVELSSPDGGGAVASLACVERNIDKLGPPVVPCKPTFFGGRVPQNRLKKKGYPDSNLSTGVYFFFFAGSCAVPTTW